MNVLGGFTPSKLTSTLKELAPRFFLPSEFPERQPEATASQLLKGAIGLSADALSGFAMRLKGSELESLILLLPNAAENEKTCIAAILKMRANRRVLELFWPFFQFHYENDNVFGTAKDLMTPLPEALQASTATRNLDLFTNADGFAVMLDKLNKDGASLAIFAAKEALLLKSPLTVKLFELYFRQCAKDGFLMNEKRLLHTFEALSTKDAESILVHYLKTMSRQEFLLNINTYILSRWGAPFKSAEWAAIPLELKQKFSEWISYRRLAEHFSRNKLKLRILSNVVPYMRHVELSSDAKFMAADFGEFLIVDDNELSSYSYFIEKDLYEKLAQDRLSKGLDDIKFSATRNIGARDFMIDEVEDSFMQLEYEDVGRLYIIDMLNIKLNIVPDLRPSKSIVRKKRQATNSR